MNLFPIKTGLDSEKQRQVKTTPSFHIRPLPSLTLALPRLSFTSVISDCPSPSPSAQGDGEWNGHHSLAAPLCGSFLLTLFTLLQHCHSHGLFPQAPVWAGTLSGKESSGVAHTVAGKCSLLYLLHSGLLQGLPQNLCSCAWSNTSTPFSFNLCAPCAVSHYLCLFLLYLCVLVFLIPLLKYVFPETPLSWLRGSAVSCSKSTELTYLCPAWGSPGLS